jgi:hypothetical protein
VALSEDRDVKNNCQARILQQSILKGSHVVVEALHGTAFFECKRQWLDASREKVLLHQFVIHFSLWIIVIVMEEDGMSGSPVLHLKKKAPAASFMARTSEQKRFRGKKIGRDLNFHGIALGVQSCQSSSLGAPVELSVVATREIGCLGWREIAGLCN